MGDLDPFSVAYGLDDDPGRLVVVRASRKRKRATCTVVVDQALTPEGARAEPALHAMTAEVVAGGATIAAAVPTGVGLARWLETPFSSRGKAARVLPSLLDLQLPFPIEQCRYRFTGFRRGSEDQVHALAVAVRAEDLDRRLQGLAAYGLDPLTIDHEGLALWDEACRVTEEPRVVAWIGVDRCTLVIGDARGFSSAHGLRTGSDSLVEDGAVQQWAVRVQHILRSRIGAAGERISWLWTGPGAEDPGLRSRLEQVLPDPVDCSVAPDPHAFLATALARRALFGESTDVNLRTGDHAHPLLASRTRRKVVRTCAAAAAAGILLASLGFAGRAGFGMRDQAVQKQVTALAMDLTGLPATAIARGEEVFVVRQHLTNDQDAGDPFSRALRQGLSQALGHGIQAAHQLDIRVSSWAARDQTFTVRGVAPAWASCERYAHILRERGINVELQRGTEGEDGTAGFVLKGSWNDG